MTAPLREQSANNAVTTLNGAINNSTTTVVVTSGSVFPSTGNFRILIESEIMLVTARSSNTLTVVRGQEGTSGASHGDTTTVAHIVTAGSFDRFGKDNVPLWGGSVPPLNTLVAADGITPLTSSDFSWVNQGGATVADGPAGTICLRAPPSSGTNIRALVLSAPSAPWTLIAGLQAISMRADFTSNANPIMGLILRESSTGKLIDVGYNSQSSTPMRFGANYWTNATTYGGSTPWKVTNPILHSNVLWLKTTDNNTNLVFSVSNDGVEWIQVASLSRTAHMAGGPNQIGIAVNNEGDASAFDSLLRLVHFHTE